MLIRSTISLAVSFLVGAAAASAQGVPDEAFDIPDVIPEGAFDALGGPGASFEIIVFPDGPFGPTPPGPIIPDGAFGGLPGEDFGGAPTIEVIPDGAFGTPVIGVIPDGAFGAPTITVIPDGAFDGTGTLPEGVFDLPGVIPGTAFDGLSGFFGPTISIGVIPPGAFDGLSGGDSDSSNVGGGETVDP